MSETQEFMDPTNNLVDAHLEMMAMVSNIVAGYVSNNTLEMSALPGFIRLVQHSLNDASSRSKPFLATRGLPAVAIEDSITPDYIVCLEDGKRMKMLKRHLKTAYNMTPEQYRERWKLPANYPMTSPNYTKKRQGIAKNIGLGKNRKKAA